jgi:CubicO group peptidase (beta-lactamase class C family)
MNRIQIWCFILSACAAVLHCSADQFDDVVRAEMKARDLPGVAISITSGTNVIKSQGYGDANLEWKIPADHETVFQLASLTKQFTAVAIEFLIQDRKLKLDERASDFLEDIPLAWRKVTIRNLLTHTSGIKNYTSVTNFMDLTRTHASHADVINSIKAYPLDFEPGDRYSYSNSGYYILGMIVEKVSGMSFDDYLHSRIFAPLGMTRTRVNSLTDIIEKRAAGYDRTGDILKNAETIDLSWPFAAGALVSTADDMARWHIGLLSGKVLPRAVLDQMWRPAKLNNGGESDYGFGWSIATQKGHRVVQHAGGIPGFATFSKIIPDTQLSITVLINLETGNAGRLADKLAEVAEPDLKLTEIPDANPDYTERVRDLCAAWAAGDLSNAPLTTIMREHLEKDIANSAKFIADLGKLQKIEVFEANIQPAGAEFSYGVVFSKGALSMRVSFTKEKLINRIELHRD